MLVLKKKQRGFSMIEVMVSLVIIVTGVLGLSGLQLATIKGTSNAHSRNVAVMLAMELSDRMRANPVGVAGGFYDNDVGCALAETQCRAGTSCTPQQIARADVQETMCGVRRNNNGTVREGGAALLLPSGTLDVACLDVTCDQVLAEHTISISWNNAKLDDNQNDNELTKTIFVQVTP
ncbi:MAG: type IV pilus assembly protein PilV [Cocleimonas sp.]|jgi:type IV pilus assembly protein PilV